MQRFRFRLAGLLRLRSQLERTARRDLATATGVVTGVEHQLGATVQGLQECERLGCSDAAHAPLARALAQGLARRRLRLQNELRAAQAQLDRARGDWIERRREQRTLGLLEDRQRQEWRDEQAKVEQQEIEELARWRAQATVQEDRT
jgi:flagellar export protein FliJ